MDVRFTPRMYIDYVAAQKGITVEEIGVAARVVISWSYSVIQTFAEITGAQQAPHWPGGKQFACYTGQIHERRVSFVHAPIGAPGTVTVMEELIACGARLFLGLGWAGSLQPHAPVGSFLVPTACVGEEGTSLHYMEKGTGITPEDRLVELLEKAAQAEGLELVQGPLWTTDAPYRELLSKIEAYRQQGVLGVDMETSAMYALGRYRNVAVCNLLVVSDELWKDWRPAFGTDELKAATKKAQRVITRALEGDVLVAR